MLTRPLPGFSGMLLVGTRGSEVYEWDSSASEEEPAPTKLLQVLLCTLNC